MKTGILSILALLALFGLAIADGHEDDEIIVRLQPGVTIGTINTRYNTTTVREVVAGEVYKVRVPNPSDLDTTVANMQGDADMLWSEFSYLNETPEGSRRTLAVIDTDPHPSKYTDQGAIQRIKAVEAHAYSTGAGVIVAVIDTGVDYNHPDLTNHMLRDPVTNQVVGWDFVDNDADPMDSTDGIDNDGDVPPQIDEGAGHGTHVAGIIALIAPDAKIVPIRVLNSDGVGTADHVADAIRYVINNLPGNKKVINLSLGIANVQDRVEVIHQVIDEEIDAAGLPIAVVASAGNDGLPDVHYPASEGDVLSIAAVDRNDVKADFSNYDRVDVSAPGVGIYSTFLNGQYATWDGTSMSTPFVTGEVALIKAVEGGTPKSNELLENAVELAVDNIDAKNPGIDIGAGRINLLKAVQNSGGMTIKKAVYRVSKQKLIVKAKSQGAPTDVLTVQGFGTMTYIPARKIYILKIAAPGPGPATITVTSSMFSTQITTAVTMK